MDQDDIVHAEVQHQLPECLRVVGYLRRLAPFPEIVRMVRHGQITWDGH